MAFLIHLYRHFITGAPNRRKERKFGVIPWRGSLTPEIFTVAETRFFDRTVSIGKKLGMKPHPTPKIQLDPLSRF